MLPIFIIFLSNHCGGLVLSYTYRWEYAFSCLVLHTDGSTHLVFLTPVRPSSLRLATDCISFIFSKRLDKNNAVLIVVWSGACGG